MQLSFVVLCNRHIFTKRTLHHVKQELSEAMIINKFCRTINAQVSHIKERMECTKMKHESTHNVTFTYDAKERNKMIEKTTKKLPNNKTSVNRCEEACEVTVGPENIIKYFMEYFPPSTLEFKHNYITGKHENENNKHQNYKVNKQREELELQQEEIRERYDWNRVFLVRHQEMSMEQMRKFDNANKRKCRQTKSKEKETNKNKNHHHNNINKEQCEQINWQTLFADASVGEYITKWNNKSTLCNECSQKKLKECSTKHNKSAGCKTEAKEEFQTKKEFWWTTPATFELYYCNQLPEETLNESYCKEYEKTKPFMEIHKSKNQILLQSLNNLSFTHVGTLFAIPALPQPTANVCCTWETITYMFTNIIQHVHNIGTNKNKHRSKLKKQNKSSFSTSRVPSLHAYKKWMRELQEQFHKSSGKCHVGTVISLAEYISFITGVEYGENVLSLSLSTDAIKKKTHGDEANSKNWQLENAKTNKDRHNEGKCLFDFPQHHTYNSTKRSNWVKREDGSLHENWNCISLEEYLRSVMLHLQYNHDYHLLENQLIKVITKQELQNAGHHNCSNVISVYHDNNTINWNDNNSDIYKYKPKFEALINLIVQDKSFTDLQKWLERHSVGVLLLLDKKWIYFVLLMHVYYDDNDNNRKSESNVSSYQTSCAYSFVVKPIEIEIEEVEMLFNEDSIDKINLKAEAIDINISANLRKGQVCKHKRESRKRHKKLKTKEIVNEQQKSKEETLSNSLFVPSTVLVYASRDMQLRNYDFLYKNLNHLPTEFQYKEKEMEEAYESEEIDWEEDDEECYRDVQIGRCRHKQRDRYKSFRNYISTHHSSHTKEYDQSINAPYDCDEINKLQNENERLDFCENDVNDWSRMHKSKMEAKKKAEIQLLFTHYMNCYLQKIHTLIMSRLKMEPEIKGSKRSSSAHFKVHKGKLNYNKAKTRNKDKKHESQQRNEESHVNLEQEHLPCTALRYGNNVKCYSVFPSPTHLLTNYKSKERPEFLAYEMRYGKLVKFIE